MKFLKDSKIFKSWNILTERRCRWTWWRIVCVDRLFRNVFHPEIGGRSDRNVNKTRIVIATDPNLTGNQQNHENQFLNWNRHFFFSEKFSLFQSILFWWVTDVKTVYYSFLFIFIIIIMIMMVHDWFHIFRLVVVKHYSLQSNCVSQSFSFTQKQKEKVVLKKGEKVFSFFLFMLFQSCFIAGGAGATFDWLFFDNSKLTDFDD